MKEVDTTDEATQALPEYLGKLRFLTFATLLGVVLSLGYAAWAWWHGDTALIVRYLIFPVFGPLLIYLLWRRPDTSGETLQVFALIVFATQAPIGLYLSDFSQLVWIPIFPLVYFYLLGYKALPWVVAIFIVLCASFLLVDRAAAYGAVSPEAFATLMVAFLLTATLSWMNTREVRYYRREISRRAHYDFLTGVFNRMALAERVEQEIALATRMKHRKLSLVLMDLDDFKAVNDTCGHHVGDQVLVEVTHRLTARLRKSDLLGRWGGEEFVVMLPDTTLDRASAVVETLRRSLHEIVSCNMPVTASFGIAEYRRGDTLDSMMIRADEALYRAKSAGKDQIVTEAQAGEENDVVVSGG